MADPHERMARAIERGYAAFRRGDYDSARAALSGIRHTRALHLLGLVEKRAGHLTRAAEILDDAARLDPHDHEIAHNQGLVARERGRDAQAEAAFRRAMHLKSTFVAARVSLGRLLIDLERWDEAQPLYERLLREDAASVPARYGLGTVRLGQGFAEEAAQRFDELIGSGSDGPEVRFMRARARLEAGRVDEALADLLVSFKAANRPLTLTTLAGVLWMRGDTHDFEALLAQAARRPDLLASAAELLRQAGEPERAIAAIESMRTGPGFPSQALTVLAMARVDAGDAAGAEAAARERLAFGADAAATGSLCTALLMQGRATEALVPIRAMRAAEPDNQHWIAYEATALRLLESPEYDRLVDLERLVHSYRLPTPAGYADVAAFNAAFLAALARWQVFARHPLDQSLRGGDQTPRDLAAIDEPVFRAYFAALDEPIRSYLREVGEGADHPLTRRNTGRYRIAGCWSVRLKSGGRHVSHVHPQGWISSAYYIQVPPETADDGKRAGWIRFGEPPFATEPPTPAQTWVRPEAGMLVLFPSYLWHGTTPVHSGSLRVTAPFDVVPA